MSNVQVKEPFVRMVKRDHASMGRKITVRILAVLLALILDALFIFFVTGLNPFAVYGVMFKGTFGSSIRFSWAMRDLVTLLLIGVALAPAFKMKFWNIGAEGQVLMGGLMTALVMVNFGNTLPAPVLMLLMLLSSIVAGGIWGLVPAFFKAKWKTNETLFTLMMNYVAIQLVEVFLKIADKSGSNTVGPSLLTKGWFPVIGGQKYLLNILIVAVVTVLVYIYLKYSKHGYEISVVGESEKTARYIGINVKKVIIRTMILSGAICGLTGLLLVAGTSHSIDSNLVEGRGFTAIMVSWLAKFNPLAMIFASVLLVFMDRGAEEVTSRLGLNSSYSEILTGIILFFIIGCEFFIQYKLVLNHKHKEVKA